MNETQPLKLAWTDERKENLRRLWADGHSASLIAATLTGVTRNAIIGCANRMGLPARRTRYQIPHPERPRAPRARPVSRRVSLGPNSNVVRFVPVRVSDIPEPTTEFNCTMLQLTQATCHYPHGHPGEPDYHYCGAQVSYRSLCSYHAAVCYQQLDRRKLVAVASA